MTNPVQPQACEILSVKKESRHEWTFRVATDAKPAHGQFMHAFLKSPIHSAGPTVILQSHFRSPTNGKGMYTIR